MKKDSIAGMADTLSSFHGGNLFEKIKGIEKYYKGKGKSDIVPLIREFRAAMVIKQLSTQIHEIVHALGIINCLPLILETDEKIKTLSLASSGEGDGIDLVTSRRIAEFKFASKYHGMTVRHVFSDFVSLTLYKPNKKNIKRELYVFNAEQIITSLRKSNGDCFLKLRKSGNISAQLARYLIEKKISDHSIKKVYSMSKVQIIDISDVIAKR